jgi:hypothetical protein
MILKPYIVRPGDYLTQLAYRFGFNADEVWQDAKNAKLKDLRPNPDILVPGDILFIPDAPAENLPIQSGTTNPYVADVPHVEVVLIFMEGDKPMANEPCEIGGLGEADPTASPPSTDGDGKLTLNVPVLVREVSVRFPKKRNRDYLFHVGDMDPITETSGVRKRLCNLGYLPRVPDDTTEEDDEHLKQVLAFFQSNNGLNPTGEIDDPTRQILSDLHQM